MARYFFALLCALAIIPAAVQAQMCGMASKYNITDHDVVFSSSHASATDAQIPNPDVQVENPNLASFKVIYEGATDPCGSPYAEDKNHVYYLGRTITDDVAHFKFSTLKRKSGENFFYAEDNTHIYLLGNPIPKDGFEVIEDPDPIMIGKTPVGHRGYVKTPTGIYDMDGKKVDADAQSFEILGCNVTRDKNAVYVDNKAVHQIDFPSFERVTSVGKEMCYFKDAKSVYWSGSRGFANRLIRVDKFRTKNATAPTIADPATYFNDMDDDRKNPFMYLKTWNSTPVD